MASPVTIDLASLARDLGLPLPKVERTLDLLDEGNTVAFITRYRKDQTGGLDEEAIRRIQVEATKLRMLAERKQTILKSIESQAKLTPELADQIRSARSTKRLEDIYLPYKPKKQTLATIARQRGLEPFAHEILEAAPIAADLDRRAADFVCPDRQLNSVAEVLHGVGHLLAERFSEKSEVRSRLRKIFQRSGRLVCTRLESSDRSARELTPADTEAAAEATEEKQDDSTASARMQADVDHAAAIDATESGAEPLSSGAVHEYGDSIDEGASAEVAESEDEDLHDEDVLAEDPDTEEADSVEGEAAIAESEGELPTSSGEAAETGAVAAQDAAAGEVAAEAVSSAKRSKASRARAKRLTARDRKRQKLEAAFKDYANFREAISRVPAHRVLAINRGERAKALRVKVEGDTEAMQAAAVEVLVSEGHPHADFLIACVRDSLQRLVIPSLERDIRRELTDSAEEHAVEVFIRNLRKLLLQPPVHGRRVLALDPGFRSGCKLAALDEFGNVLENATIFVIGNAEKRLQASAVLADMIRRHGISLIAIGNGVACRDSEQLVAETLSREMSQDDVAYVIVNEAGASVYSTSPTGREELPDCDAVLRSAVSIGRRLLDPLSELVKINPSNIGVGLYQHDVKAKHLRESLDAVVQSCVNFVGVDANSASPALLSYVSGLNQLTARRFYDYRREHGPFRSREQFREVPGIGEATFIQSAGFLKIVDGDNPLDATWIHPESYGAALRLLEKLNSSVAELAGVVGSKSAAVAEGASESGAAGAAPRNESLAERAARVNLAEMAKELEIGEMLLKDLLSGLTKPRRDPRDDLTPPLFRRGVLKLEDLKPGMELTGTVLNVVDFGAFVDIGISDSSLVHISRLADHYVRDPHEVVSVGDVLRVWVIDVDRERRRVALTAIAPKPPRREADSGSGRQGGGQRPQRPQRPAGTGAAKGGPPSRPASAGAKPRPAKPRPAPKPKIVKPITDAMAEGREPLRSFSDLAQFFQRKQDPDKDTPPKKS
jgi:uncharacterized protein